MATQGKGKKGASASGLLVFISGAFWALLAAIILKTESLLPLIEKEVFYEWV